MSVKKMRTLYVRLKNEPELMAERVEFFTDHIEISMRNGKSTRANISDLTEILC